MADSGGQSQSFSSQANPFSELRADRGGGAGRGVCSTITGTGNDGREGIPDASRRPRSPPWPALGQQPRAQGPSGAVRCPGVGQWSPALKWVAFPPHPLTSLPFGLSLPFDLKFCHGSSVSSNYHPGPELSYLLPSPSCFSVVVPKRPLPGRVVRTEVQIPPPRGASAVCCVGQEAAPCPFWLRAAVKKLPRRALCAAESGEHTRGRGVS